MGTLSKPRSRFSSQRVQELSLLRQSNWSFRNHKRWIRISCLKRMTALCLWEITFPERDTREMSQCQISDLAPLWRRIERSEHSISSLISVRAPRLISCPDLKIFSCLLSSQWRILSSLFWPAKSSIVFWLQLCPRSSCSFSMAICSQSSEFPTGSACCSLQSKTYLLLYQTRKTPFGVVCAWLGEATKKRMDWSSVILRLNWSHCWQSSRLAQSNLWG